MRLHCLGTAGYHPSPDRHTSCYFLPESGIMLDAGSGVFRLAPLIQTETIDVLLSHAHLDHICGLTFLLDVFYQRPVKKLRIWGEAAKLDAIKKHLFSELIFPVDLDAEWLPIDQLKSFKAGGATVTWRPQDHPGGSVGYRIDWAGDDAEENDAKNNNADKPVSAKRKSLVYLTDTTGDASKEGIDWCGRPDLLMHECYFDDSMKEWAEKTGHSWTGRLTEIAREVEPAKLLVTHINPLIGTPEVCGDQPSGYQGDAVDLPSDFQLQCDLISSQIDAEAILAMDELVVEF